MEYLTRLIKLRTSIPNFNFHPKCSRMELTHLCFADDLLFFCRGDLILAGILKVTLDEFGDYSGLRANLLKSTLFLGGVSAEEQSSIQLSLGIQLGSFPMRYLGVPLGSNRLSITEFSPVISKITWRVQSWSAKCLSYAGHRSLVAWDDVCKPKIEGDLGIKKLLS
ncbi:hypothetical protein V2J09_014253 [Rumex salicifolius]